VALRAKMTLAVLGSLTVALILAFGIASLRQARSTSAFVETVLAAAPPGRPNPVDFQQFEGLPLPVGRYLRHVLRDGQQPIQVARLRQVGELRTDVERDRWSPFEASHVIAPLVNGFVWNARLRIAPLLHVRVRDAYFAGQGSGRVSLVSAITVAAESGRHEMNAGSLHRYLAEAVWYPTALLPSSALRWSPISDTKALATLTDAGVEVSLEFWFNDAGEVTGIYSPGRWGRFQGQFIQTPWEGHFRQYERNSGMLVPSEGEVGWYAAGQWRPVWRGRIVEASYELAP